MGLGITHEATIKLKIDYDGSSTAAKQLKTFFDSLNKAVNISKLDAQFKSLRDEIDAAKAETQDWVTKSQGLYNELIEANKKYQAAIDKTASETKQASAESAAAGKKQVTALVYSNGQLKATIKEVTAEENARAEAGRKAAQSVVYSTGKVTSAMQDEENSVKQAKAANDAYTQSIKREDQAIDLIVKAIEGEYENSVKGVAAAKKVAAAEAVVAYRKEQTGLTDLSNAIKKTVAESNRLVKASNSNKGASRSAKNAWDNEFESLERLLPNYVELYKRSNAVRQASSALSKQNQISAISMSQWDRQFKDAMRTADRGPTTLSKLRDSVSNAEKQMDALFRAAFRMQMVGSQLRMFAQDIIRWGSSIMTTFGEFEFQLNRAAGALSIWQESTISGRDGTEALTEAVTELGINLKLIPLKEVAQAVYFWGSATGQAIETTDQLTTNMTALQEIMKVSTITETGYEATIKGVYSILTQYYHGAISKAADVTDLLFFATQKTALEFEDLVNSFKMVGPVAAQANVPFEEMVNLLGKLGDLGIRGTMAGRAFRQMFIQMVKPSGPAKKALASMFAEAGTSVAEFRGKSYFDIMFPKGQFVGTTNYIKNLALALKDVAFQQRAAFLAQISTANELPVLTALVGDQIRELRGLGTTTKKNLSDIDAARAYTQKAWERFGGTWVATIGSVRRAWEGLQITIGRSIADALEPFVRSIKDVIDSMIAWARQPANKQVVEFLSKLAGATAGLAAVAGAVATLAGALISMGAVLFVVTKGFGKFVPALAVAFGAVVALADGFIRNFDLIQSAVQEATDNISSVVGGAEKSLNGLAEAMHALVAPSRLIVDMIFAVTAQMIKFVGWVIKLTSEANILAPALKIVAGLIGSFVAAKTLVAFAALIGKITLFTKAMALMRAISLTGIAASFTSVGTAVATTTGLVSKLALSLGKLGMVGLIIGIGTVAYEVFPAVHDFVDDITDNFRNLNQEIQETADKMGSLSFGFQAISEQVAKQLLTAAEKGIPAVMQKLQSFTGTEGENTYQFSFRGKDYTSAALDRVSAINDFTAQLEKDRPKLVQELLAAEAASVGEINTALANANVPAIDPAIIYQKILDVSIAFANEKNLPGQAEMTTLIAKSVFSQFGLTGSKEEINGAIQGVLSQYWGNRPQWWLDSMARWLTDKFYNPGAVQQAFDENRANQNDLIYKPFISWLENAASGMTDQQMIDALTRAVPGRAGVLYEATASIMSTLTPETKARVQTLIDSFGIGQNLADTMADPVASAIDTATEALVGAVSGAKNIHYKKAYDMWTPVINNLLGDILGGDVGGAANAFLALKGPLLKREFAPAMHEALLEAGRFIIQEGGIDEKTVKEIIGLLDSSADKEAAKAAEQIRKANEEAWTKAWEGSLGNTHPEVVAVLAMATALMERSRTAVDPKTMTAITNFANMLALRTEGGIKAAVSIFKKFIAPVFDQLPADIQGAVKESAAELKMFTGGTVDLIPEAVAVKSRREWAQQFTQLIPKPDDIRKAIKDFLKHPGRGKKSFKGGASILSSKDFRNIMWGPQSSIESRDAGKQVAVDIINGAIAGFHAAHKPGDKKFYTALLGDLAGDKGVPKWVRRRAQAAIDSIMKDVVVKPPQGTKPGGPLSDIFTAFGLNEAAGKTTKKNPANVWLEVHAKGGTAIKRIMALASQAVTDVTANLAAIAALDWVGTGTTAGTQFGSAILTALKESGNFYRQIQDWSFLVANTDYTVTGTTVGNEIGQGIINGLHQKLGGTATGNKVEVAHTETRNININLNVESKDKSADRANQASVRQGTMDALVAAGLEHDVTIG